MTAVVMFFLAYSLCASAFLALIFYFFSLRVQRVKDLFKWDIEQFRKELNNIKISSIQKEVAIRKLGKELKRRSDKREKSEGDKDSD